MRKGKVTLHKLNRSKKTRIRKAIAVHDTGGKGQATIDAGHWSGHYKQLTKKIIDK